MVIQAAPKPGSIVPVCLTLAMFIAKPETAGDGNESMEEVAVVFESVQREAAERCEKNKALEFLKTWLVMLRAS